MLHGVLGGGLISHPCKVAGKTLVLSMFSFIVNLRHGLKRGKTLQPRLHSVGHDSQGITTTIYVYIYIEDQNQRLIASVVWPVLANTAGPGQQWQLRGLCGQNQVLAQSMLTSADLVTAMVACKVGRWSATTSRIQLQLSAYADGLMKCWSDKLRAG